MLGLDLYGPGHVIPGGGRIVQAGILVDRFAQSSLGCFLTSQQCRVKQPGEPAIPRLAAVLYAEEEFPGLPGVLLAASAVNGQQHFHAVEPLQNERVARVAEVLELGDRRQPVRPPRMTGNEDQLVFLCAGFAPFQIVLEPGRLAVFIDTEKAHIEVEARVFEIVGIAAVEGDLLLRREDQADIGVFLVAIKMILPALVKRDHVTAQTGLIERLFFDFGHDLAPGQRRLRLDAGLDRGIDALGHILNRHEHVQLQVDAFFLLVVGFGVEAVAHVVMVLVAELLQAVGAHVMVGHHQAVGRDKRPGAAAVEADGRLLHVLKPLVAGLEVVLFLEVFAGRVVEEPHAFVGMDDGGHRCEQSEQQGRHGQTNSQFHFS